jgi:hypothetical protein
VTRPASDSRFAPQTLAGAVPGSRDLGRRLADLELWLLEALKREGAPGLAAAVEGLNELGHELAPLPEEDPPRWSGPLPDGERRLVISGAASAAAEWVSAALEPLQGHDGPPEPDPRHAAFYARWETLLGLDAAAVDALEPADRMVHHLALLEAEVNNGGFLQYLDNTEGRWLRETLEMLDRLQAHRAHGLLAEVQRQLAGASADRPAAWNAALSRLEESGALDTLDDRFYALDDDIAALAAVHLGLA